MGQTVARWLAAAAVEALDEKQQKGSVDEDKYQNAGVDEVAAENADVRGSEQK